MPTYHPRNRYTLAIIALIAVTCACMPIRSKQELTGTYELNGEKQKIRLEVFPDGSFSETIISASGRIEKSEGNWQWKAGFINFDKLWIPQSFAPDYILKSDASGRTQFTVPGYWSITPEKYWGKVVLSVFPDSNINFIMQQNSR
jgi:hypothetical protein